VSNTAVTWFDIGVGISEWIDAAFEMDADKMIDINYEIADDATKYTMDAMFFTADLYSGGSFSLAFSIMCMLTE